jgi:tRNA nucleotidyltransferase (CCA-adding enzyme)
MPNHKLTPKTVITGHVNADFDCLAAIIAASRLHEGAALVFPGSQEKTLRNFFIESATFLFNFVSAKDIDPDSVETLVVVDTRQRSRLTHVQSILDRDEVEVIVYDHHPESDEDIEADEITYFPWGATTTILVKRLQELGRGLGAEEATILGLGIYEDTGSFTFNSTTPHDLEAAAMLLSQGMDLNVLADLLTRELNAEQISVLNSLLDSAQTHDIHGVQVVLAETSTEHYVGDFALIVHKFMDMENLRVLFAMGRMEDRIHIVARSRSPEVDVGAICEHFGGGGHYYAASAAIKERTLAQVKDELFALLYSQINRQFRVDKLMTKPALVIGRRETLERASEFMTRFGLKAVPVTDENMVCRGILENQLADKALSHGLGEVQVTEYMNTEARTLTSESSLYEAMEIIIGQRQRLVPIVSEKQKVIGVLSRTDLINLLVEEPARIPESLLPERKRERNIAAMMRNRLPQHMRDNLETAGRLAQEMGFEVYSVGGFVRDVLLGSPTLDLDLVVEGEGIPYAAKLAKELGGRVRTHKKFKTAVVVLDDNQRIDVATARLEYYEYPAAMPTVELSSIKMDLYRRDFTINALAVHLNPDRFGRLVDFFGAQRDLKERVIRVLHSLSFVEDPTRILRAVRFEQRFKFRIGGTTERLIKNAIKLGFFQRLSGGRIMHELGLIFEEQNVVGCLLRLQEFGLLSQLHPKLKLKGKKLELLNEVEKVLEWYKLLYLETAPEAWKIYLLALSSGMRKTEVEDLAKRLSLSKRDRTDFAVNREMVRHALEQLEEWKEADQLSSRLYFILEPVSLEGLLYLMARSRDEKIKRSISVFLTRLRYETLDIGGHDLQQMGVPEGPLFGRILARVKAAKLDGTAESREEQLELAEEEFQRLPTSTGAGPEEA